MILDVVYQHVDPDFPYYQVYLDAGVPSPMIGGQGPFGPVVDYSQQFARDYVHTATSYRLQEYHVDGFRYDEVTDLYDGPTGSNTPASPTTSMASPAAAPLHPQRRHQAGNTAGSSRSPRR